MWFVFVHGQIAVDVRVHEAGEGETVVVDVGSCGAPVAVLILALGGGEGRDIAGEFEGHCFFNFPSLLFFVVLQHIFYKPFLFLALIKRGSCFVRSRRLLDSVFARCICLKKKSPGLTKETRVRVVRFRASLSAAGG